MRSKIREREKEFFFFWGGGGFGARRANAPLQPAEPVLLVDVAVPLLLLAVLEHHGDAQHQQDVDADDAERGGEDQVHVAVREAAEGADAARFLRGDQRVRACAVLDEHWRGAVLVTAAGELLLQQTLGQRSLLSPDRTQVRARLQSSEPDDDT